MNSPIFLNTISEIKKEANMVFTKVDTNIYKVDKDRTEQFSGRLYVDVNEVINALNHDLKVAIFGINDLGMNYRIHQNF